MGKPCKTAEDVKAIDWSSLIQKLTPLAAAFLQALIEAFLAKQGKMKCGPDDCCCQAIKDLDDKSCEALCNFVVSYMDLSDAVQSCPCDKGN